MSDKDRRSRANLIFVNKARDFFKRIGLPFKIVPSYIKDPPNSFFKGCWLDNRKLYFCPKRVQVGELLHEAGHLALTPKADWHLIKPGNITTQIPLGYLAPIGDAAVEAWDYAAAKSADIPELAVFTNGFNGAGWQVWESFDERRHPGFVLLRFLGMSSDWGKCDRWFIGDSRVEDGLQPALRLMMENCTVDECKLILSACKQIIKDSQKDSNCN